MSKWKSDPSDTKVTGRVIYKLTKPRAKTAIVYCEDSEDPWFISEYTLVSNTQNVKHRSIFIAKDVPSVIKFLIRQNWVLEKIEDPIEECAKID